MTRDREAPSRVSMDGRNRHPRLKDRVIVQRIPEQLSPQKKLGRMKESTFANATALRHFFPCKSPNIYKRQGFFQAVVSPPQIPAFILNGLRASRRVAPRQIAQNGFVVIHLVAEKATTPRSPRQNRRRNLARIPPITSSLLTATESYKFSNLTNIS